MRFPKMIWQSVLFLLNVLTGTGRRPDALSSDGEAVAAVFLPLTGLLVGFLSAVAAAILQSAGFYYLSILAGIAVLTALGLGREIASSVRLLHREDSAAGGVAAVLLLLLIFFALMEMGNARGAFTVMNTLLFLPVAGSLAMVTAACAMPEPAQANPPLARVKNLHLALAAMVAFLLFLPQYGALALAYLASSALAGAAVVLLFGRREYKAEVLYAAALLSELLFISLTLLALRPRIFY